MLRIDHVIYGVQDLDKASHRFEEELGLSSVAGGYHPMFGTGNRIIPIGDAYIELMAVTDPIVAQTSDLGRFVAEQVAEGDRFIGWAVSVDDIAGVASRLKQRPVPGLRRKLDGREVSWRSVGMDRIFDEPWRPFFIHWNDCNRHPSRELVQHRARPSAIRWIEVGGDPEEMRRWLLEPSMPVRHDPSHPGVHRIGITTIRGELVVA